MPFITALYSLRLREAAAAQRRDRMRTLFLTVVCDTLAENLDYVTSAMLRRVCVTLRVKFASFGPSKACMEMMRTYALEMRERANSLHSNCNTSLGHLRPHRKGQFLPPCWRVVGWYTPSFYSDGAGFHLCSRRNPSISVTLELGCRIRIRWTSLRYENEMVLENVCLYEHPTLFQKRCKGTLVYTNFWNGRVIHGTFDKEMRYLFLLHQIPWDLENDDICVWLRSFAWRI
jgi:hypothetical protein